MEFILRVFQSNRELLVDVVHNQNNSHINFLILKENLDMFRRKNRADGMANRKII